LAGLNRLYDLGQSRDSLHGLGAQLGSDVPFFLSDGLAVATGRGEVLTPLPPWPPQWLVLANPGVPISTAWAYREASSKLTDWQRRASIHTFIVGGRLAWPPSWAFNRLEAVVLPHRGEVRALQSLLREGGGWPVLMSGSGASLFAVVPDAGIGHALAARAQASGAFAAAVTTLPHNPILAAMA
ncbi:MAG: 4-(cytidine 5'-diphospho)-2-C-methyl-D-erythritol kinase, partial [candidate division NC10 bacterium]|nr:4-(cytidine 5'-diphospho)-2-C-methyl-D-erythritol kinase [candidate division NC10 bacterium]